jgi:hypothetical protein
MENETTIVEELFYKLKDYGETTLTLYKLKAISKVSGIISATITYVLLMVLFFLVLICISVGLSLLIGSWLGHTYWGFFIMTAIYILIGLILFSGRKKYLKAPISDKLIKELID